MTLVRPHHSTAHVAVPKLLLLKSTLLLALLTLFLVGSRVPSELKKLATVQNTGFQPGAMNFTDRFPVADDMPLWQVAARLGLSFWDANTNGMVFAIVLGAAGLSLALSSTRIQQFVAQRGLRGIVGGVVLGMPLNMCANCSAVSACGIGEHQPAPETTFGVILGSALFNVIGLFAIWMLFPWPVLAARLVFSGLLTFLVLPLLSRWLSPSAPRLTTVIQSIMSTLDELSWRTALVTTLRDWWDACARLATRCCQRCS